MRKFPFATAALIAFTTAAALNGTAHASDPSIYVTMIVGAKICGLDKDPAIKKIAGFAVEELGKRVLNKEITSEKIAAFKSSMLKQNRAGLCEHVADLYRRLQAE
jgi:hypothetical protein